jgi:hypothetical protein
MSDASSFASAAATGPAIDWSGRVDASAAASRATRSPLNACAERCIEVPPWVACAGAIAR